MSGFDCPNLQAMYGESDAHHRKNPLTQRKSDFHYTDFTCSVLNLFLTLVLMTTVRRVRNDTFNEGPRKRSCCICYEMQVDSLLYRYLL